MKRYYETLNHIHAPQEQVDTALDRLYADAAPPVALKKRRLWQPFAAAAAVTAIVLAVTIAAGSFGRAHSGLTITANAAEIRQGEFVSIGSLNPSGAGTSVEWDDRQHIKYARVVRLMNLNLTCKGRDIDRLTFSLRGEGYFGLNPNAVGLLDVEECDREYSVWNDNKSLLATSYTMCGESYTSPDLVLYAEDEEGEFCRQLEKRQAVETDENGVESLRADAMDGALCLELFQKRNHTTLDVTAHYADGTRETQTIEFAFEPGVGLSQENDGGITENTIVEVSARLKQA